MNNQLTTIKALPQCTVTKIKSLPRQSMKTIGVTTAEGIHLIKTEDILYCKASSNYTEVHTKSGKMILVSKSLGRFDLLLDDKAFIRPHKSYILNTSSVVCFGDNIVLYNGETIPVSRRSRKEVKACLARFVYFV